MQKLLTLTLLAAASLGSAANLTGSGSSFVYPLFSKMFAEYKADAVNYQSVGSGAGQKQLKDRVVDFAGTDVPIPDADISGYPGKVLTIPVTLGAVVPVYNVPGVSAELKFSGRVLADIYLGKVRMWNDPALVKLNAGVALPPLPITVVHRSDGSGTTGVWTEYLGKVNPEWKGKVGSATSVQWPLGVGAKGSDGVAGAVKSTPGSLGYVELTYALSNKINYGSVQNRAGQFVKASTAGVQAAAASVVMPTGGIVSITNATGAQSYPISTYSYVIFYQDQKYGSRTAAQASALKNLLTYIVTGGQAFGEALSYVPLPQSAQTRARAIISTMTFGGAAVK